MRLLNAETLRLEYFQDIHAIRAIHAAPEYAILSHTWGDDEILFQDLDATKNPEEGKLATTKASLEKVLGAAREALFNRLTYIWIDSCCIDKSSSAELSEAINSMFNWYAGAKECYAYLSDFTIGDEGALSFDHSRWFSRGWTLQELIAPSSMIFFDSRWKRIGTRAELALQVAARTKIPISILNRETTNLLELRHTLDRFNVSARMLWAEGRETTRAEDRAYSLMGIFDVNMPLLYGEGHKAFTRLQEIILTQTNDQSILAFSPHPLQRTLNLAGSPGEFVHGLETYQHIPTKPMVIVSGDIEVDVLLCPVDARETGNPLHSAQGYSLAVLHCNVAGDVLQRIGILLRAVNVGKKEFTRVSVGHRITACFKLEAGDDGKTWAVSAPGRINNFGSPATAHIRRLSIMEFERTRIVIKQANNMYSMNPGRELVTTEFPLQISLRGPNSGEFWLVGGHRSRGETQDSCIRVNACAYEVSRVTPVAGAWDRVATGIMYVADSGHVFLDQDEAREKAGGPGFSIMWGYKFPSSSSRTWDPREDEMVCFVFPGRANWWGKREEWRTDHLSAEMSKFADEAARVCFCWNGELNRGVMAKISTKTVLDRRVAYLTLTLTLDISSASQENREASDESKATDESKANGERKTGDEGKTGKKRKASDEMRR